MRKGTFGNGRAKQVRKVPSGAAAGVAVVLSLPGPGRDIAEVVSRGCAGALYLALPLVALVNAPDVVSLHYEFQHFRHEG